MSEFKDSFVGAIPLLEIALGEDERLAELAPALRLRETVCGLATGALCLYMKEADGVHANRIVTYSETAPREYNCRRMSHVILSEGGEIGDPTPTQFLKYVGITPQYPEAEKLYQSPPYGLFDTNEAELFSDTIASEAYRIDPLVCKPESMGNPAVGVLKGKTYVEMRAVYRDIWTLENYDSFPLEDQPSLYRRAEKVMSRMVELAATN